MTVPPYISKFPVKKRAAIRYRLVRGQAHRNTVRLFDFFPVKDISMKMDIITLYYRQAFRLLHRQGYLHENGNNTETSSTGR